MLLQRSKRFALNNGQPPRRPLITVVELVMVAAALTILLRLILPEGQQFKQMIEATTPDDLSISYLQNLLRTDSHNIELHLMLASAQAERIEYHAIEQLLKTVEREGSDAQRRQAMQIRLRALIAAYHAGRSSMAPPDIDVLLHTLAEEKRPTDDLAYLAESAQLLGRTDLALQLYLRIAREQPQQYRSLIKPDTLRALVTVYRSGENAQPPPEIDVLLHTLVTENSSTDDLATLAESALLLGRDDLSWLLYLRIADKEPEHYRNWIEPAALRSLGLGNYRFAANLYFLAQERAELEDARTLFTQGVGALMASSRFDEAMIEAERHLGELADDADTLRFLVRSARAANDNTRAAEYARRLVTLGTKGKPRQGVTQKDEEIGT